jgi:hypothetical protein
LRYCPNCAYGTCPDCRRDEAALNPSFQAMPNGDIVITKRRTRAPKFIRFLTPCDGEYSPSWDPDDIPEMYVAVVNVKTIRSIEDTLESSRYRGYCHVRADFGSGLQVRKVWGHADDVLAAIEALYA